MTAALLVGLFLAVAINATLAVRGRAPVVQMLLSLAQLALATAGLIAAAGPWVLWVVAGAASLVAFAANVGQVLKLRARVR